MDEILVLDQKGPKEGTNRIATGLVKATQEVRRLNERDVNLYVWITNKHDGRLIKGMAAEVGGACDNINHKKSILAQGPSRSNSVIDTALVS